MESKSEKRKVILWTSSRSLSTAFLKSVSQLDGVKVLHEPFSQAFMLGPQGPPGLYKHLEVDPRFTYEAAFDTLCNDPCGKHLFAKIPSATIFPRKELLLREEMKSFKHVFLIRDPRKTVFSHYRLHTANTGMIANRERILFAPIYDLKAHLYVYNCVREHYDENSVIIDADDLLKHSEVVMKEFCDRVGFTYDAKMLQWEPAAIPGTEDLIWKSAFKDAAESTGFREQRSSTDDGVSETERNALMEVVDQCQPLYQELCHKRFVPNA